MHRIWPALQPAGGPLGAAAGAAGAGAAGVALPGATPHPSAASNSSTRISVNHVRDFIRRLFLYRISFSDVRSKILPGSLLPGAQQLCASRLAHSASHDRYPHSLPADFALEQNVTRVTKMREEKPQSTL